MKIANRFENDFLDWVIQISTSQRACVMSNALSRIVNLIAGAIFSTGAFCSQKIYRMVRNRESTNVNFHFYITSEAFRSRGVRLRFEKIEMRGFLHRWEGHNTVCIFRFVYFCRSQSSRMLHRRYFPITEFGNPVIDSEWTYHRNWMQFRAHSRQFSRLDVKMLPSLGVR